MGAIKEDILGENNLTSEHDDIMPKTAGDQPNRDEEDRSANEDIDFEGLTNPSVHKVSANDLNVD